MTPPDAEDLLEHVVDHLCEEQPEAVAELSDAEIRRRALHGVARAQGHGFEQPEAITAFVTLMFLVAPDFDRQPSIAKALADRSVPAPARLRGIFEKTSEADWEDAAERSEGWGGAA